MSLMTQFAPSAFVRPWSSVQADVAQKDILSSALRRPLDRVRVLGDDNGYGHSGCVNALSWAQNGSLLLSGGDDTTVHIWQIDESDPEEYPFKSSGVIHTGHTANIFNTHMLPHSTRIVTAAGDHEIRVFDVVDASTSPTDPYNYRRANVIRCHDDRVKRIVTESSPDTFMTISEDGSVRQHDLRTPKHRCRTGTCPPVLMQVHHELSTLSLSPLTPYHFVVAGDSPYGFLYDRRYLKARQKDVTSCVKRFGRQKKGSSRRNGKDHITGSRMSAYNGHEVLLSYSGDATYMFSTLDNEGENTSTAGPSSVLSPNKRSNDKTSNKSAEWDNINEDEVEPDDDTSEITHEDTEMTSESEDNDSTTEDELSDEGELWGTFSTPIVFPRQRYAGARNVETVKDVNFLGPWDDIVVSGSDDGNFFMWSKQTGELQGIYEGDSCVVNVVEGHPSLPLIAVSGIDTTVKLFSPVSSDHPSQFNKTSNAERIVKTNAERATSYRSIRRSDLASLIATATLMAEGHDGIHLTDSCPTQ